MNFEALFGVGFSQIILGFARASGLMFTAPVFQSRNIIPQVKIVLAFALALVVAPFISSTVDLNRFTFAMAVFSLVQELIVGLIMGFMVNMTIYAVQLAGYFFDVSMGFGVVNIIDPTTGTELPLLGQFNYILTILVFLGINGHHTLIISFIQSYNLIKPGALLLHREAVGVVLLAFSKMFYLGFKIGLPILASIFLADVALGIISKLIPQVNVFIIGFPVKILLGLVMLIFFIPIFVILVEGAFGNSSDAFRLMRAVLIHLH